MSNDTKRSGPASGPGGNQAVTDLASRELNSDTRKPIRLGLWVLLVGFGGFLLWAGLAPLDEGVAAPATVSIETKRRMIQHMNGGVVKDVPVKEGQVVKAGDTLIELGSSGVRANFESVRQSYMAQRAAESRALAELFGKPTIEFHADLRAGDDDPVIRQHMATQTQLFTARKLALEAEMNAARESIHGFEAQIAGITAMLESRQTQAKLQAEQIGNVKALADEGYAPTNQLLQLQQQQAELRSTIADLTANRERARQSIAETRMRMVQRTQDYRKEASAQLADVRREVQALEERLQAASEELERVVIKSPVDGQVVGLAISAIGGVVTPGQKLMDIVPKGETLVLDAKIPTHVIDRVRVGAVTDVRFSAFAHSPQLVVEGRLVSVSGDALTEQQGAATMSYYLGRVEITPDGLHKLGARVMQPGMPAELLIRGGERTLLTYLLHPLTKRVAAAMREE
ncbi:MAG: hypothetical protein RIS35_1584 [Pseudomonadota bacterium]|jgi:protease secretion system membrane fusion protein